ncbi:MAG: glycosyltransferase family 2 protein [bacterium]
MVDILLTTYNGEVFIKEQLNSIFNQTYKKWQILIRDDGSNDNTLNIVKEYQKKSPDKITIIQDDLGNIGATLSFAELMQYSKNNYFMFCDQDDVWLNTKIEKSINAIKEIELHYPELPILVFTDLVEVDQNLNILSESFIKKQKLFPEITKSPVKSAALNVVAGCTCILNNKAISYILPIKSNRIVHDQWVTINIAKYGIVSFLDFPSLYYRQHNNNFVGANNINGNYFLKKISSPIKQFSIYKDLIFNLNFKISIIAFLYYKFFFTLKRLYK